MPRRVRCTGMDLDRVACWRAGLCRAEYALWKCAREAGTCTTMWMRRWRRLEQAWTMHLRPFLPTLNAPGCLTRRWWCWDLNSDARLRSTRTVDVTTILKFTRLS